MSDGLSIILEQVNIREVELEERRQQLADLVIDITEAERDKVRLKASKGISGFWFFAKKVFPEYFKYPFGTIHKDIVNFANGNKRKVYVVAGPPEHGKTTLLRIFKIWSAIYGKRHYIIKVCETIDLSLMDMKSIKLEFEFNPRINFLYGDLKTRGSWEENRFAVAPTEWNKAGTLFEAFAYGIPPTGRVWKQFRPDFADIDDLENYKKSANIVISKEKLQFINNDIIPRMAEDSPIIWFGNNARRTMAMNIIIEMAKEDRKFEYPAFEIHVYPAWNVKKNKPLWIERFGKYKTQEEMRVGLGIGMMTWLGNFMQTPISPEGGIFKRVHWQEYSKLPTDARGIIRCDPASGKANCYKAAVVLLYSPSQRKFYIPDCYVRQSDWEPYFLAMYDLYERFEDHIIRIDWESNFYQDQYLKFRELYPSVKDRPELPINPVDIKSNKDIDIQTLAIPYEFSKLFFAETFAKSADGQEGKAQLLGYPDHPYNDFPDALARAYKTLFAMFAGFMRENDKARGYESLEQSRFAGFK